jgi:hypothetical protein
MINAAPVADSSGLLPKSLWCCDAGDRIVRLDVANEIATHTRIAVGSLPGERECATSLASMIKGERETET